MLAASGKAKTLQRSDCIDTACARWCVRRHVDILDPDFLTIPAWSEESTLTSVGDPQLSNQIDSARADRSR